MGKEELDRSQSWEGLGMPKRPEPWTAKGTLLAESEVKTLSSGEVGLPSAITGWHYCSPQA